MSKLWLIGLAASAAWTPAALAQGAPAPMAHGAHAPAPPAMHPGMHPGMHRPMPGPGHMKGMKGMKGHMGPMPGPGHMKGMKGHRGPMPGMHRFGRGHVIPPHFRGGQFVVHDWRMFGFPAPMPGGHWIRYHDDALLIDRDGRVMDGRYGWDWDRRGGGMAYDDGGYEDRDYDRDDYDRDDYARGDHDRDEDWRDEDWDEDGGRAGHHGKGDRVVRVYRHGGSGKGDCRRGCGPVHHVPPPPQHGYGYGYGYGYGAGCACGPVVITETTTTTAPVVEMRTYYETVTEHRAAPRRHYVKPARRYVRPAVRRSVKSAPAPRPGERG